MSDARAELIDALADRIEISRLSDAEIDAVLELASVAAHGTGDRTTAPLASFLAGIAAATSDSRLDVVNELRERAAELKPTPES